jgi:hypothetical protein
MKREPNLRGLFFTALLALALVLGGPAGLRAADLNWDLQDGRVAGLSLQMPAEFARSGSSRLDFDFTLKIRNNRPEPVTLKKWELRLEAMNLGQGEKEGGELRGKYVTLAPGETAELKGHFFMGPARGKGKSLGIALGKAGGGARPLAFDLGHGDVLAGLVMTIGTSTRDEFQVYVAKYHYDESRDTIGAYFVLGK